MLEMFVVVVCIILMSFFLFNIFSEFVFELGLIDCILLDVWLNLLWRVLKILVFGDFIDYVDFFIGELVIGINCWGRFLCGGV